VRFAKPLRIASHEIREHRLEHGHRACVEGSSIGIAQNVLHLCADHCADVIVDMEVAASDVLQRRVEETSDPFEIVDCQSRPGRAGWPLTTFRKQIAVFLREHRGAVCSECIAMALALPARQVAITTLGLDNRGGFVMKTDESCSRCGSRGRVIRAVAESPP
jgi:hypothetical protein